MKLLCILADMKLFNNNQVGVGLPNKNDHIAAIMSKTWKCPVERWSFDLVHWMGHENNILCSRCVLERESPFKIVTVIYDTNMLLCNKGIIKHVLLRNGDPSLVFNTNFKAPLEESISCARIGFGSRVMGCSNYQWLILRVKKLTFNLGSKAFLTFSFLWSEDWDWNFFLFFFTLNLSH